MYCIRVQIPRGRGNFRVLSGPFKRFGNLCCSVDVAFAAKGIIRQQKGLFSMPGKHKQYSKKFLGAGDVTYQL